MIVNADPEEVTRFLDAHPDIKTVDLLIADANGVLRGKQVTVDALRKVYRDGVCLPGSIFALDITGATVEETGLGFDQGDADRLCRPVAGTLAPVPWSAGNDAAQLLMSMYTTGERAFFADPRHSLARVIARLGAQGLTAVVAVEMEFYLIDTQRDDSGAPRPPISPFDGKREHTTQVYSIDDLAAYRAFLDGVSGAAAAQNIPADTAVAEYAPGQFEINLKHRNDALRACDDAVLLKRIIRAEARRCSMNATFMAKPYASQPGSGMHVHVSILDAQGQNIFASDNPGGSRALHHAAGGMLTLMAPSMALFAPNVNAFRRFQPDNFVPLAATWGINNRTTALRVPAGPAESRRLEHRVAGADANPYIVVAAVLAGAALGLEQEIDPGAPCTGNAYGQSQTTALPANWSEALEALAGNTSLDELLGHDFLRVYLALRLAERERFRRAITPLEYQWYLTVV